MIGMLFKRLGCIFEAIPYLIKTGVWSVHTFEDVYETKKDIYVSCDGSFRVAKDYRRHLDEVFVKDAKIRTSVCIKCGKVKREWLWMEK